MEEKKDVEFSLEEPSKDVEGAEVREIPEKGEVEEEETAEVEEDPAEATPAPLSTLDSIISNLATQLIKSEWNAVDEYKNAIVTLEDWKKDLLRGEGDVGNVDAIIAIFNDIESEEMTHIGQLERSLQSKNDHVASIQKGQEEAAKTLDVFDEDSLTDFDSTKDGGEDVGAGFDDAEDTEEKDGTPYEDAGGEFIESDDDTGRGVIQTVVHKMVSDYGASLTEIFDELDAENLTYNKEEVKELFTQESSAGGRE